MYGAKLDDALCGSSVSASSFDQWLQRTKERRHQSLAPGMMQPGDGTAAATGNFYTSLAAAPAPTPASQRRTAAVWGNEAERLDPALQRGKFRIDQLEDLILRQGWMKPGSHEEMAAPLMFGSGYYPMSGVEDVSFGGGQRLSARASRPAPYQASPCMNSNGAGYNSAANTEVECYVAHLEQEVETLTNEASVANHLIIDLSCTADASAFQLQEQSHRYAVVSEEGAVRQELLLSFFRTATITREILWRTGIAELTAQLTMVQQQLRIAESASVKEDEPRAIASNVAYSIRSLLQEDHQQLCHLLQEVPNKVCRQIEDQQRQQMSNRDTADGARGTTTAAEHFSAEEEAQLLKIVQAALASAAAATPAAPPQQTSRAEHRAVPQETSTHGDASSLMRLSAAVMNYYDGIVETYHMELRRKTLMAQYEFDILRLINEKQTSLTWAVLYEDKKTEAQQLREKLIELRGPKSQSLLQGTAASMPHGSSLGMTESHSLLPTYEAFTAPFVPQRSGDGSAPVVKKATTRSIHDLRAEAQRLGVQPAVHRPPPAPRSPSVSLLSDMRAGDTPPVAKFIAPPLSTKDAAQLTQPQVQQQGISHEEAAARRRESVATADDDTAAPSSIVTGVKAIRAFHRAVDDSSSSSSDSAASTTSKAAALHGGYPQQTIASAEETTSAARKAASPQLRRVADIASSTEDTLSSRTSSPSLSASPSPVPVRAVAPVRTERNSFDDGTSTEEEAEENKAEQLKRKTTTGAPALQTAAPVKKRSTLIAPKAKVTAPSGSGGQKGSLQFQRQTTAASKEEADTSSLSLTTSSLSESPVIPLRRTKRASKDVSVSTPVKSQASTKAQLASDKRMVKGGPTRTTTSQRRSSFDDDAEVSLSTADSHASTPLPAKTIEKKATNTTTTSAPQPTTATTAATSAPVVRKLKLPTW